MPTALLGSERSFDPRGSALADALSIELALLASHGVPTLEETDDDGLPLLAALSQQRSAYDERLLPQGAECQCADCGWLFGGLTGFDRHVSKGHADPLSLGLVARFRSAAVVWVQEYAPADANGNRTQPIPSEAEVPSAAEK